MGGDALWLEKVRLHTSAPVDDRAALAREDALGGLLRAIRDLAPNAAMLAALGAEFEDLALKLPVEIRDAEDGLDPRSPALLAEALEDVKALLLDRLLAQGDAA